MGDIVNVGGEEYVTADEFRRMEIAWREYAHKLEKELAELRLWSHDGILRVASRDSEPIHLWFNLTYANYLTIPRSLLQSMPHGWQERFVACLEELQFAFDHLDHPSYRVNAVDKETGRYIKDPIPHYNRGRTRVEPRID